MASERDGEPDGELGGGRGEEVGHDRQPHPGRGAGLDVEIVEPLERAGDDLEPATAGEERRIDAIRHEGEHGIRVGRAQTHPGSGPWPKRGVGIDLAECGEPGQHLAVHPVGDEDARTAHASPELEAQRCAEASTMITQMRIAIRIAET